VPIDDPACRAAILGGEIILNRWSRSLLSGGPERVGMRAIEASLADLRLLGDELVVTPVPRAPWSAGAQSTLLEWAAMVGYRRVWLPDQVVDLGRVLAPLARAGVRCPTCGATWEDDTVVFWERVRRNGWFPGVCLACGGSLPEWRSHATADRELATTPEPDAKVSGRGRRERHP
jgi:hypothetical protein